MRPTTSEEVLRRIQSGELIAPDTGALQPAPKPLDKALQETEGEALTRRHRYLEVTGVFLNVFDMLRQANVSIDEFYDWASRRIESENTEHFRLLRSRLYSQGLLDDEEADPKAVRLAVLAHQQQLRAATSLVVTTSTGETFEVAEPDDLDEDGSVGEEEEDLTEDSESEEQEKVSKPTPNSLRRRRASR